MLYADLTLRCLAGFGDGLALCPHMYEYDFCRLANDGALDSITVLPGTFHGYFSKGTQHHICGRAYAQTLLAPYAPSYAPYAPSYASYTKMEGTRCIM